MVATMYAITAEQLADILSALEDGAREISDASGYVDSSEEKLSLAIKLHGISEAQRLLEALRDGKPFTAEPFEENHCRVCGDEPLTPGLCAQCAEDDANEAEETDDGEQPTVTKRHCFRHGFYPSEHPYSPCPECEREMNAEEVQPACAVCGTTREHLEMCAQVAGIDPATAICCEVPEGEVQ